MRPPCALCGHPADWHRHDDVNDDHAATDPDCPFRCLGYDCTTDGPVPEGGRACTCPDWQEVNPFDEHTRMWGESGDAGAEERAVRLGEVSDWWRLNRATR